MLKPLMTSLLAAVLTASAAAAGPAEDAHALYERFYTAQNQRDLGQVGALLLDSPDFLWISDGKPVWGRPAALARMASFQEAELWRVEPRLAEARAVDVGEDAAFLHVPLRLHIGAAKSPDRFDFLVGVLCRRTPQGWRIAALFTTAEKREP